MTLQKIKERFLEKFDGRIIENSGEKIAHHFISEFSKLIEEVRGEIKKKHEKRGWIPLGKGEDPWNAGLDTALQIFTKVISDKE